MKNVKLSVGESRNIEREGTWRLVYEREKKMGEGGSQYCVGW